MGQHINIPTTRTQCIGGYLAQPQGKPKGGIVVIQEIFGVTAHIRRVADGFAAHGYTAIAPAFFDHLESGVELGYDQVGANKGKQLIAELGLERALEDVASAAESIASAGRIGTVGYCWGGTVALLAALRLGLPSVSYYGARNLPFLHETPRAPVMFHFGEKDRSITPEMVAKHREALPQMEVFTYPADHAFNRDGSAPYHEASAKLALERTLAFFEKHLAGA
ncbi:MULTISPECIES: dienelactone hydrolase family protein [Rhodanobacter]|uniref:dienelactone hydrolase family protein n=1 Tax=Rhodanobacter TaxID=75309 RepID=UPI000415D448|nr:MULTISPECIES: dienelactone hydrolase family protein [Rhodanobacter]KZC18641.1 carboxymethylenebutenolidase [Rhodanobacter denitrificans]UJJ52366.1 dienelactone hydrolase family protein [Rhodanobacter denitrificans]UJM95119.1 dienelactone hydrolase family protein [Rhodanobacter denitrificans]UJM98650.1 dienelactone hydrolase family protein [Rhodanobacter denitrificans]UJN21935.1 dienelactone hydrolase family protein [Rhodanobacter denitrificans]